MALTTLWKNRLYAVAGYLIFITLFWLFGKPHLMKPFTALAAIILLHVVYLAICKAVYEILLKKKDKVA